VPEFQAPVGTFDVLPPQSARYERLVALYAGHVGRAGYGLAISPMFEDAGVFSRVGESTDVVRKEMYDFDDKGGRRMALRPEGTASVVRAFVEHHPQPPFKAWYVAPNFRYERPQKGR
jgi:histidyl-tRNA synthetase